MSTATGAKAPGSTPPRRSEIAGVSLTPWAVAVILVSAMIGMTAALVYGGASDPRQVADPGSLVRWGLPTLETVHNIAMATVMGALLLAIGVVPRFADPTHKRPPRNSRDQAAEPEHLVYAAVLQLAQAASVVWTVSAIAVLIFTYSDVSGTGLGAGENYTQQLTHYVTEIATGQAQATVVIVAAVVTTLIFGVRALLGLLCTLALSMVALVALALNGHSSGGADHMGAVNSLGLHLLGVCLWVGGLIALAWAGPLLAKESTVIAHRGETKQRVPLLAVVLRRYSVVALGCYFLVLLSGIINAQVRIGTWEQLNTGYGGIVLAKLVLTLVLMLVGYAHRQWLIPGVADGSRSRTATLWRVIVVELVLMGLLMGIASALSRTAPPVPEEMPTDASPARLLTWYELPPEPTFGSWFTEWRIDWFWAAVVVFFAIVYLWAAVKVWRRGDQWSVLRTGSWLFGLALLMYATSGGVAVYARVLFSAHMVEHMSLTMIVPLFLVSGAPVTVVLKALEPRGDGTRGPREWILRLVHSTWGKVVTHPIFAAANFAFSIVLFYFTDLFHFTLRYHVGHEFMMIHFLFTGYMFALVLIGIDPIPKRPTYPMRLVLLLATMAAHAFIGISIMSMTAVLQAGWFGNMGRPWGPSALEDQELGGMLMWGIGEFPTFLLAVIVAILWALEGSKENRRVDRQADRTDDAELKAYNEMMANLAEQDERRR
ncbi:bifunctional copper resistance protein CopD/cytochrome c oxidase assembly protein [Kocuria sp. cx-116]|uniref:cytochrome c oxidase assembly protein n=1 Tax=Kocuria sp. cx-116 TaxID=2771378 RepID=UPI001685700D|nr:cytochrome c oxidase assembly protein [Kocuria sp. cx-116]MBD2761663.1 bifunctional copper resistance protein CopD/cytochrome c oxidase assembly protein [Kocuria sp. cx-116]